jgi:outer membrane receptor protein involved in Fe transport
MSARYPLVASLSICLLSGSERAYAQAAPGATQTLPPVTVTETKPGTKRGRDQRATQRIRAIPTVLIYPTTPLPGSSIEADKVPAAVTIITATDIARTQSLNITDALVQNVPSIMVNEVAGNPFQPDVQFRGFVSSPVSGTPQGLAVYQNGVRINEAFGDAMNWDLIPTAAIQSVSVVTNNPAFGLNALGGALVIQMKDGFNYHGTEINTMAGSYGRIQSSGQWGREADGFAVYGAIEGLHDGGFREFSTSNVHRFYGDVGFKSDSSEFHMNMGAAQNTFGAAGTVPIELLQKNWSADYTTPQTSENRVGYINLTAKVEVTPTWTLEGITHARIFDQQTQDGNPTGAQPCDANAMLLCFGDGSTPANGLNGLQLNNPFGPNAFLGENDRTTTHSTTTGASLQATNTDQLFGHGNHFVIGGSFDYSATNFTATAELGTINQNYVLTGSGIFLGTSGSPVSDGPVSLHTINQYTGVYALDTFDVTKAFAVTGGGRFNVANVTLQDQLGTALNGNATYTRFNPTIGGTYKINSGLTAYAGYSEANRAPTPLELGCADPAHPCILATFLVADPPLQQVVSKTVEAGLRGTYDFSTGIGKLDWKLGAFRTTNSNDILNIADPNTSLQGFGYFQNVGSTRRQGIEAEASLKSGAYDFRASYAFIDARFLDSVTLGSNSPFADINGNIQVQPGDQIPAIPRHRVKLSADYNVTDAFKIGGDVLYVSSQYFAGDASNQAPQLPGYAVVNMHASYQIDKTYQVYVRADNIFNNLYASYGTFFDTTALPNFANGGAPFTDPRSLSPARPLALYAGLRATF